MKFVTKKRAVLFLLFIFPLICFLILSTGENNFTKLPVVSKNIKDLSIVDSLDKETFKERITVLCFLGNDIESNKSGFFNLNEKIYKTFLEYKQFQVAAIYPLDKEEEVAKFKNEISLYTDMINWKFIGASANNIAELHAGLKTKDQLSNLYSTSVYLVDKNGELRGRLPKKDVAKDTLFGYNITSVAELNDKLKDDIKVLYYEYYAAFKEKNKNKADRKEVGL